MHTTEDTIMTESVEDENRVQSLKESYFMPNTEPAQEIDLHSQTGPINPAASMKASHPATNLREPLERASGNCLSKQGSLLLGCHVEGPSGIPWKYAHLGPRPGIYYSYGYQQTAIRAYRVFPRTLHDLEYESIKTSSHFFISQILSPVS